MNRAVCVICKFLLNKNHCEGILQDYRPVCSASIPAKSLEKTVKL